jgi:serine phosphatase RsbU (regulator of sigma subunit)
LLSFIGYFLLNNIVDHDKEFTAGEVLDRLHTEVRTTLKQDQEGANARDGMDIALCKINKTKNELQFSGAHRPLYYLRDGELSQYRGSPKAIGGIPNKKKDEQPFINHVIKYQKSDKIFFFSDGLPDQIGGDKGRKYQVIRIRDEILNNLEYSMPQYMKHFSRDFRKWQGEFKQIDDVLMIGIEF